MEKLKPKEPKPIALIFTATAGLALGALLGIYALLTTPPARVSKAPSAEKEEKPGDYRAYYAPGRTASVETPNLRTALARIERRAPGPVTLSEEELNYLFNQQLKRLEKAAGDAEAEQQAVFDQLDARLVDGRMILSGRMVVDPTGDRFAMLIQAHIDFENHDTGPEIVVRRLTVNSLPIPAFAGIARSLIQARLNGETLPEDWQKIWQNLREIQIEEGKLTAQVGARRA